MLFELAVGWGSGFGLGPLSPVQPHCRKDLGYMSPQVVRGEEEGSIALRLTWADHRRQLRLRLGSWWRGVIIVVMTMTGLSIMALSGL